MKNTSAVQALISKYGPHIFKVYKFIIKNDCDIINSIPNIIMMYLQNENP